MRKTYGVTEETWQERVDALRRRYGVVGAQFGIVTLDAAGRPCERVVVVSGSADAESRIPVTRDMRFEIGSITKMWTTILLLQLVADAKLSLDTPVGDILPEIRDREWAARVTVGMLLTHTSGIEGDVFIDTGTGDDAIERYVASLRSARTLHAAGSRFSYCNSGFVIAGRIVEVVRGVRWSDALQERLIAPLELAHTDAGTDGPRDDPERIPGALAPAGLIRSTADDMLVFARMLLRGGVAGSGAKILDAHLTAGMSAPLVDLRAVHPTTGGWGLGTMLERWGATSVWGHDGATIGQRAYLRIFPARRSAAVLLTTGGRADGMFRALFDRAVDDEMPPALSATDRLRAVQGRSFGFADTGAAVSNARSGALLTVIDPSPTGGEPQRSTFDLYDSAIPGLWAWTTPDLDGWAPFRMVDGGAYLGLRYLPERRAEP